MIKTSITLKVKMDKINAPREKEILSALRIACTNEIIRIVDQYTKWAKIDIEVLNCDHHWESIMTDTVSETRCTKCNADVNDLINLKEEYIDVNINNT